MLRVIKFKFCLSSLRKEVTIVVNISNYDNFRKEVINVVNFNVSASIKK